MKEHEVVIEGLPPELDKRVNEFIDSAWPTFHPSKDSIGWALGIGAMGLGLSLVGVADEQRTKDANEKNPEDKYRTDARHDMTQKIDEISVTLERSPDEVQVCRDEFVGRVCDVAETYEVTTELGTTNFVRDELQGSLLKDEEKTALVEGLPSEVEGVRTESFDQELIEGLEQATDAYVATVPDREADTTNLWTGDAIIWGGVIAVAGVISGAWLGIRRTGQLYRLQRAHDSLEDYRGQDIHRKTTGITRAVVSKINNMVSLDRFRYYDFDRNVYISQIRKGSKKAREEARDNIRTYLQERKENEFLAQDR